MRVSNKYFKLQECILDGSSIAKWKWSEVLPFKLERLLFKISFSLSGAFSHLLLELYQSIECNLCSTNCFGEWTTQISKKEKGIISTNVQGVCDPNLKFIYVLPGWEGFISNGRVLRVVLCSRHSFHIPNDNNFYFLNNVSIMINLLVYYFYRYC